jgi:formate hydrogenlyase subunit 3/multisubunit Na+/H+ antiporter MnhD subunit
VILALALLLGVLLLLSLAGLAGPRGARPLHAGCMAVSAGFVVLAAGGLALGGGAPLLLPIGPPWAPLSLVMDALSAWFLLLLGLCGLAAGGYALAHEAVAPPRRLVPYPLFLAGMALTLLAADGFTLLLGFELMSVASWVLVAADHGREDSRIAARLYLGFAIFGAGCLIPAVGLLVGLAGDFSFAALRAAPPAGWVAFAVMVLVLLGAGSKAGLVPLHGWLPLAHPAAPSHVSALMSGAMTKVALYVVARLLLDLGGPAQPLWWGLPLLLLGAASALLGALRANLEGDAKVLLACSTIENVGLVAMGLGLAAILRAADLGPLASLAAGAALLHALAHGLFKTLLFLAAGEVAQAAGSRRLDSLGGLIHPMPWVAACALAGAAAAAALPPFSGFAGEWLLLQALMAAWRVGEFGFQVLIAACTAVAGLAAALGAAAMLRFWGLAFLGRPRTPRTLGAQEAPLAGRVALAGLATLGLMVGLVPGPLLRLAAPALELLTGHPGMPEALPWSVSATSAASDYWPVGVFLLLLVLLGGLGLAMRRASPLPAASAPAWDCGFIAPPPHLPFGDPASQPSAAGFAQPLHRMLGTSLLGAEEHVDTPEPGDHRPARLLTHFADPSLHLLLAPLARLRDALVARAEGLRDLTLRQCLGVSFGTLVALLALLAWLEAGG